MIGPDAAFVVTRFVFDAAVLFLWGSAAYLRFLVPGDLREVVWSRLRLLRITSVLAVGVATVVTLPLRSAMLGNGWQSATDLQTMLDVLTATSIGSAWAWQCLAMLMLLACSAFTGGDRSMSLTAFISALLLAGLTMIGHATMNSGWIGTIHQMSDALHVLAAGAWVGALLPVVMILRLMRSAFFNRQALNALIRFSTAGHVAVAIVVFSGVLNTMLILGGLPDDWSQTYQLLLTGKIMLVAVMILVAVVNRYWMVPRMARSRSAEAALTASTIAEIGLAVVVVALVACLGMLEPTAG